MQKRYLVFISSTFADLEDERKTVIHALQKAGYFVSAMELFPSDDRESWEVIQQVIDQSDYYVLVIAGRYGSLAPDGVSYTEKEYHYARERGIPVLAFLHRNRDELPSGKVEHASLEKLDAFISTIDAKHTRTTWSTKDDLATNVLASLSQKSNLRPAVGWVRGDAKIENELLKDRLNELQEKHERLREHRDALVEQVSSLTEHAKPVDLAWGDDITIVRFFRRAEKTTKVDGAAKETPYKEFEVEVPWDALFDCIAPHIVGWTPEWTIRQKIISGIESEGMASCFDNKEPSLHDSSWLMIRSQLVSMGFIEVDRQQREQPLHGLSLSAAEYWKLSELGMYEYSIRNTQRKTITNFP